MNVKQLIELLRHYPDDATVEAYDPDFGVAEITGLLHIPDEDRLLIQTDDL